MSFPKVENETRVWLQRFEKPFLSISCGAYTYGRPKIRVASVDKPRRLHIGRYCSIGNDVSIFVGRQGRHPTNMLSSYPLMLAVSRDLLKKNRAGRVEYDSDDPVDNGSERALDVYVGHDVWIGIQVTIMAGVTIGSGAVIGAGAVVTKDVEPYSIVGGVPAKTIRSRHTPEICQQLLNSQWWTLEPDELFRRCGQLLKSSDMPRVIAALSATSEVDTRLQGTARIS